MMAVVAMIVGSLVALLTATVSYGMLDFNFVQTLGIYFASGTLAMILTFIRLRVSFPSNNAVSVFK